MKNHLLQRSRSQGATTEGRKKHIGGLEEGSEKENERFRPLFPYNPELRTRFKDHGSSADR